MFGDSTIADAGEVGTCPRHLSGGSTTISFTNVEDRLDFAAAEVAGIVPVDGYRLFTYDEQDGDGFTTPAYFARGPWRDVKLPVSRFQFTPTQGRFEFLVRNGFPQFPGMGNWSDDDIDAALMAGWAVTP